MTKSMDSNQQTKKTVEPKAKARAKATHPPTSEMVLAAIKTLKDRKGSSVQAIKKYIAATYMVDIDKMAMYIKKFLRSAVDDQVLVQTKGVGASGSFKLGAKARDEQLKAEKSKVKKSPAVREKVEKEQKSKSVKKSSNMGSPKAEKVKEKVAGKVEKKKASATKKVTIVANLETTNDSKAEGKKIVKKTVEKKSKNPAAKTKAPKPKKVSQQNK